jgi:RND family efflux transporter MFP subunit
MISPTLPLFRVALLLAGIAAGGNTGADGLGVTVPVAAVGRGGSTGAIEFDAVLQAVRQATVTAQVGGNVLALRVKAGDSVKRGQALVRLDDRDQQAGLLRSDAAVAQADAELRLATTALNRNRELLQSGFVSRAAVDSSQTQVQAAEAGLKQARAARAQAGLAQGHSEPGAPFDALVLATHVESGDLALPGRPLATLYEPGRLRAVVNLPLSQAAIAATATRLKVLLPEGRALVPVATELLPSADPVSQTVEWRLALPGEAASARPGQMVRVLADGIVVPADATRLTVPQQAVLRRGELTAVYVATPQGFALRAVRLGSPADAQVEVLAGLSAGEKVALDPVRAGLRGATALVIGD